VINAQQIRSGVERRLGRKLDDETWAFAESQEWIDATLEELESDVDEDRAVAGLADRILQLLRYRSASRSPEHREIPPDGRDEALARVLAALASREPGVIRFRREVLRGQQVGAEHVAVWVRRRARREGAPTFRRVVLVERGGEPLPTPLGVVKEAAVYLDLWNEQGWLESVPIREDGVLGRLKKLSAWLGREYSFREPDAVTFILSGYIPPSPRARASYTLHLRLPARSVVRLEVNPRVSPREVAEVYASMRGRLLEQMGLGTRSRSMTEEHAELAIFVSEHDAESWDELRVEWNASHPDRPFTDVRRFIRDVRAAYRRVTGDPLAWKGKE
jgi:hypothetical protein